MFTYSVCGTLLCNKKWPVSGFLSQRLAGQFKYDGVIIDCVPGIETLSLKKVTVGVFTRRFLQLPGRQPSLLLLLFPGLTCVYWLVNCGCYCYPRGCCSERNSLSSGHAGHSAGCNNRAPECLVMVTLLRLVHS